MAQWVRVRAARPEILSQTGAYMVEGENSLPKIVLGFPHTCSCTINKLSK